MVTGGDPSEAEGDGVFLPHDQRYAVTDEFLTVWKQVLGGDSVDHIGPHLRVKGARVLYPPVQKPHPPLWLGGSSPAAHDLAARHIDLYLTWGETPAAVAEKIADVRRRAASVGRSLRFGIRLHVIVRETSAEAWAAADRLISRIDDAAIAQAQRAFAAFDSEGQRRMSALHGGRRDRLEVSPNLWAGVGLVRGGAGTALVGDPDTVAERMREYTALGIDTFILSGYPHLEEAYRTAELLFPRAGDRPRRRRRGQPDRPVRRDDGQPVPPTLPPGITELSPIADLGSDVPMDTVSTIEDIARTMPVLTLPNAEARSLTVRAKALVFQDPRSQQLLQRIHQVAPSEASVLIIGETGTGKELVARHIHNLSARRNRPSWR